MHLDRSNNFWKASWKYSCLSVSKTFVTALSSPQFSHNDSLWAKGITKSHREQRLHYREAEELSWCPSCSNSLWQGWSCGLVHCPGGNATDPIWRVLASSDGIISWTPFSRFRLSQVTLEYSEAKSRSRLYAVFSSDVDSLMILQTHEVFQKKMHFNLFCFIFFTNNSFNQTS